MIVLVFFCVLAIALLGSVSGVGGGVLYVPLLLLVFNSLEFTYLKFVSTVLVLFGSLINVIIELIRKKIKPIIIFLAGISSFPGIVIGKIVSESVEVKFLQIIILIFLAVVSILLIISEYILKEKDYSNNCISKKWYYVKIESTSLNCFFLLGIAFFGGLITALTGMGGGPIIMPMLLLIGRMNFKNAGPVSHCIICISGIISVISSYKFFGDIPNLFGLIAPLAIAVVVGTLISYPIRKKIRKEIYIKWLLIILIWISIVKMIIDII